MFESYNQTFGKALTEKGSLTGALDAWQDEVVAYAKSQASPSPKHVGAALRGGARPFLQKR